jgi:hypothetical protein
MKITKNADGDVLTVKITLPKIARGGISIKKTTSNIIGLPELERYDIVCVLTQSTIVSSETKEVTGEWTFQLRKTEKPKRVSRKVAKKVE